MFNWSKYLHMLRKHVEMLPAASSGKALIIITSNSARQREVSWLSQPAGISLLQEEVPEAEEL